MLHGIPPECIQHQDSAFPHLLNQLTIQVDDPISKDQIKKPHGVQMRRGWSPTPSIPGLEQSFSIWQLAPKTLPILALTAPCWLQGRLSEELDHLNLGCIIAKGQGAGVSPILIGHNPLRSLGYDLAQR